MCMFLNHMPTETVIRLWDSFFIEGPQMLLLVTLALLRLNEDALCAAHDEQDLLDALTNSALFAYDGVSLLKLAHKYDEAMTQSLSSLRRQFWATISRQRQEASAQLRIRTNTEGQSNSIWARVLTSESKEGPKEKETDEKKEELKEKEEEKAKEDKEGKDEKEEKEI